MALARKASATAITTASIGGCAGVRLPGCGCRGDAAGVLLPGCGCRGDAAGVMLLGAVAAAGSL